MDFREIRAYAEGCFRDAPPPCSSRCPFGLDVRGLIAKVRRGAYESALRAYREAVIFPGVVARSCPAYCGESCVRARRDRAVNVRLIEAGLVERGRVSGASRYAIPLKNKKVAVVGAGFSGLAFASRMAAKGYAVTVMEEKDRAGGSLRGVLPDGVLDAAIDDAFFGLAYELVTGARVADVRAGAAESGGEASVINVTIERAKGAAFYDAVYVATGEGGEDFGLRCGHDARLLSTRVPGVFLGGGATGSDPVRAIENGLRAAASAEEYLMTGRNEGYGAAFEERAVNEKFYEIEYDFDAGLPDYEGRAAGLRRGAEKTLPTGGAPDDPYAAEARRCPMCNCSLCIDACELIKSYGANPKRIASDLGLTVLPIKDKIKRVGSRMLNSCNLCGICDAVCPAGVETCRAMYESRRIMGETGHIPPVFHDFWTEDLRFTLSDEAYAVIGPGEGKADLLFFPGCQLAASSPDAVRGAFDYLRAARPNAALMLSCCGVPAEWAREDELLETAVTRYREVWEKFGKPLTLFACSTCRSAFARTVPEAGGMLVYEWLLANGGGLAAAGAPVRGSVHVFDPCASKDDATGRAAVRRLAELAGMSVENPESEPGGPGGIACCGFGGHIYPANPGLAEKIARGRAFASESPYLAYCANCRDLFLYAGKECRHILDVYFGSGAVPDLPSLTQRRDNRRELKASYAADCEKPASLVIARSEATKQSIEMSAAVDCFASLAMTEKRSLHRESYEPDASPPQPGDGESLSVDIAGELEKKMDRLLLLRSDIEEAIRRCEKSGKKLVDPASGRFTGFYRSRAVTVWVEYEMTAPSRAILRNTYTHRMEIVE
jgi:Fe-S oxidoreductase